MTHSQVTKEASHRTRSFSFSSSSSSSPRSVSSSNEESPISPTSPLGLLSTIPFSWEQHPGIPKQTSSPSSKGQAKKNPTQVLLPLPPATASNETSIQTRKKKTQSHYKIERDPFIAALMECSKDLDQRRELPDSDWKDSRVSRSISDRFGFIDLYSCKRTCSVADSMVLVRRSSRPSYRLLERHRPN